MSQATENPDRDFSADGAYEVDAEAVRALLKRGEVADICDPGLERRVGAAIAGAVVRRSKSQWEY